MKTLLIATALLVVALVVLAALTKAKQAGRSNEPPRKKAALTANEQAMYNRLTQSLPDLVVLAQVSFGALLTARSYATRNTFDRKIADFVVFDRAFQVLAIIELDDSSHKGKEARDAKRDTLLTQAGYRVLRYPRIPDIDRVKADFAPPPVPMAPPGVQFDLTKTQT